MIDRDGWVVVVSVLVVSTAVFIYLSSTGVVPIDWNSIFNIKEYPKTSSSSSSSSNLSSVSSSSKVEN